MSSTMIFFAALGAVFFVFIIIFNSLVVRRNAVKNSFGAIDAMLKRRFDLIPNLVSTVKASAKFETSTLERVIQLRSQMNQGPMSPAQMSSMDKEVTGALRSFFVQVEAYPDLKSSQNFIQLQNALHDVEDQIAAARRAYNSAVTNFNNAREMFPSSMVAGIMGFGAYSVLETPDAERVNPNVGAMFG